MWTRSLPDTTKEILEAKHIYHFYKALKRIRYPWYKGKSTTHTKKVQAIRNSEEQYKTVKEHFQKQFYDQNKCSTTKICWRSKKI